MKANSFLYLFVSRIFYAEQPVLAMPLPSETHQPNSEQKVPTIP